MLPSLYDLQWRGLNCAIHLDGDHLPGSDHHVDRLDHTSHASPVFAGNRTGQADTQAL
jgi:hypothetical protein